MLHFIAHIIDHIRHTNSREKKRNEKGKKKKVANDINKINALRFFLKSIQVRRSQANP